MKLNNLIINIFIYIYIFFLIYMPPVSNLLFNIRSEAILVLLLATSFTVWMFVSKKNKAIKNQNLILISGIILSSFYFAFRASLSENELRLIQNLFILIQFAHVFFVIEFMKLLNFKKDDMIKVLFNLGLVQGIICIIMLVFPITKNIALSLYYLGREENIFISRMRIYGISGDYTFFTPIYHGIIATLAYYYTVLIKNKYAIYIPFILVSILLNGRTGFIVFILGIIVGLIYFLLNNIATKKILILSILGLILLITTFYTLNLLAPYTYKWVIGGITDTGNLITGKGKTGIFSAIGGRMLHFPSSYGFIFGEGHRVYSKYGVEKGYIGSDVGYVNDMYMGGLIYILIQYTAIIWFILSNSKQTFHNKKRSYLYNVSSVFFIFALLISNLKGEAMRSGAILIGIVLIKNIFLVDTNVSKQ